MWLSVSRPFATHCETFGIIAVKQKENVCGDTNIGGVNPASEEER